MDETLKNRSAQLQFLGMTYKYHADALADYPAPAYQQLRTPFLVVAGDKDSSVASTDAFVQKAQKVGSPIKYIRVNGMDHYIRKREDIVTASFNWLAEIIHHPTRTNSPNQ